MLVWAVFELSNAGRLGYMTYKVKLKSTEQDLNLPINSDYNSLKLVSYIYSRTRIRRTFLHYRIPYFPE